MTAKLIFLVALALLAPLPRPAAAATIADARSAVVRGTLNYLNTPYLWGGMHRDTGMDCSAFAKQVYADAGLQLPRVARVDHVGIYVGKGYFVHASFTNGVHIDSVANPYYFSRLVAARKYAGF
jgi:peptidoglycan endopeptidase LytF